MQRSLLRYRLAVILASFGMNAAFFVPLQNLLPRLVENLAVPEEKGILLGIVGSTGALVALVINPIAGHLSDKRARTDGRRSWLVAGLLMGGASLFCLPWLHSLWGTGVLWAVTQLSLNVAYAPMVATVVDHIPTREQGLMWGYIGVARATGAIAGFAMLAIPPATITSDSGWIALLYVTTVAPLVFIVKTVPPVSGAANQKTNTGKIVVLKTKKARDFWEVFVARLLVSLAGVLVLEYLFYYLQDTLHYSRPTFGQTILIALSTTTTIGSAVVVGKLSDQGNRRRWYVMWATALLAVCALAPAISPTWPTLVAAALLLGVATGTFVSAGQSLVVQTLPDVNSAGRDLGIMNIGATLPQVVGPMLGSLLIYLGFSYRGLFAFAACLSIGALVVLHHIHDQA